MPIFILLQKQQSMQTLRLYFVKPLMIGTISNDVTRGKRLTTWLSAHSTDFLCLYMPQKSAENVTLCATRK